MKREPKLLGIGKAIALRRKGLGIEQVELAPAIGVSKNTLSRVENGHSDVSTDLLERIAVALDTTPEELLRRARTPESRIGNGEFEYQRLASSRQLPPRVSERIAEYLAQMQKARIPAPSVAEAERYMVDQFGAHNAPRTAPIGEDGMLDDVDSMWAALKVVYSKRWGVDL